MSKQTVRKLEKAHRRTHKNVKRLDKEIKQIKAKHERASDHLEKLEKKIVKAKKMKGGNRTMNPMASLKSM